MIVLEPGVSATCEQVFATTSVPDKYSTVLGAEWVVLRILWCPVIINMITELW